MEGLITHSNSVSTISTEEKDLLLQKQTAISNGNYILADQITKRIKALQSQRRSKSKMNILKSKQETLQALDKLYKEDLSSFNSEWELKENQLAASLEEKEKSVMNIIPHNAYTILGSKYISMGTIFFCMTCVYIIGTWSWNWHA